MSGGVIAGFALAIVGAALALIGVFGLIFIPVASFPQIDAEFLGVFGLILAVVGAVIGGLSE